MEDLWIVVAGVALVLGLALAKLGRDARREAIDLRAKNDRKKKNLSSASPNELITQFDRDYEATAKKLADAQEPAKSLAEVVRSNSLKLKKIKSGLTPPAFSHSDSESLKKRVRDIRQKQFEIIQAGNAVVAYSDWTWMGSKAQGHQMVEAYRSLLLRAFNAEFDAIRKQMRFATKETAENKLDRLDDQLARLGETAGCHVSNQYVSQKMVELSIWWRELDSINTQKLERKKQREILRKQSKERYVDTEEMEDAISYKYADLRKAKEIAKQRAGLNAQQAEEDIRQLQTEIKSLEDKFARATAQAQVTRAGYVYIISNQGSFGEGIVKIGMTRRLEPLDRVRELGDASVPFRFDVHALIFTENAPSLEKALHNKFSKHRLNKENLRKEFFVSKPEQVSEILTDMGVEADWYFEAEAREYNESVLLRKARAESTSARPQSYQFPAEI